MVTILPTSPLGLNCFRPRRDDQDVPVLVGSLGGFEVLWQHPGGPTWTPAARRGTSSSRALAWTTIWSYRGPNRRLMHHNMNTAHSKQQLHACNEADLCVQCSMIAS